MRKLFLGAVLLLLANTLSAQAYTPFPEDTAVWQTTYFLPSIHGWSGWDYKKYTMMGDTVINSVSYNKLYLQTYSKTIMNGTTSYSYGQVSYFGGMRQDSVARKVYFLFNGENSDSLLYDFSIHSAGDTVPKSMMTRGTVILGSDSVKIPDYITVRGIDSIIAPWNRFYNIYYLDTASISLKGYCNHLYPPVHMEPANSGSLIEGIGTCWGLFERLYSTSPYVGYGLSYFCDNKYSRCQTEAAGIKDISMGKYFQVSPNPFNSTITISLMQRDARVKLINSFGEFIFEKQLTEYKLELDLQDIPVGMYFLQVNVNGQIFSEKILKY